VSIVTWPAKVLTTPTVPVAFDDRTRLDVAADLLIELDCEPAALAVAAPQIGSSLRMYAYREPDGELVVLVNPAIVEKRGKRLGWERCLSFPGERFRVVRPQAVVVHAQTLDGDHVRKCWHDLYARMACHEDDHLHGVLITERAATGRPRLEPLTADDVRTLDAVRRR